MFGRSNGIVARIAAALFAAGLFLPAAPASAEGLFESIFNGLSHVFSGQPPAARGYADSFGPVTPERTIEREHGPATAFCVRSCDGHYFPVRAHAGLSAAQACHAFCPASETRIYSGSNIDYAVARDGSRYASMKNAYLYRKHLVAGCTCNGHNAFGLAHIDAAQDPTLRPGDVVATKNGLVAYTGARGHDDNAAAFTPVQSYPRFSQAYRDKLSAMKVSPPAEGAPGEFTSSIPAASDSRSAQLEP